MLLIELIGFISTRLMVCQPNDSTVSHVGELSSETLTYKKVRGYIVDGGCRDSEFISKIGFPVWNRYFTPRDVIGKWVPESFDKPIVIGGVTINPGDYPRRYNRSRLYTCRRADWH